MSLTDSATQPKTDSDSGASPLTSNFSESDIESTKSLLLETSETKTNNILEEKVADDIEFKSNYIHSEKLDNDLWKSAYDTMNDLKDILTDNITKSLCYAYFEESTIDLIKVAEEKYRKNINSLWSLYGENYDTATVETINKALSHGFIKAPLCLMIWVFGIGRLIIRNFDHDAAKKEKLLFNKDNFEAYVKTTVTLHICTMILDNLRRNLHKKCKDECDKLVNGYDGIDVIDDEGNWQAAQ